MRASLSITAFVLLTAATALAQPPFRLPASFPIGGVPRDLLITDFNGDDHLDLLSTNFDGGTISVLLGTGTGDFTPLEDQPASGAPLKVVSLFADADANLDLIISESESDFIYLLRGNGDGTFGEPEPIDAGHDPWALTIADMNKDTIPDIVETIATEGGGRVNVLLGEGDGHYILDAEAHGRRLNEQSFGIVTGDFDEDGNLDAAATTIGRPTNCPSIDCGTLSVMLGDSTGALARSIDFATGPSPYAIAVADLDHDGHLDLITADSGADSVSIFKGSGKLPVTPEDAPLFTRIAEVPAGLAPESIALTDFTGDGWVDLVVGNVGSGDISVIPGLPGGGFGLARHFLSGLTLKSVGVGDFNEDLRLDLVGLNQGDLSPAASLLLARPEGGYQAVQTLMPTAEQSSIAAADIRGNGVPAIVLNVTTASEARVLTPDGVQNFSAPLPISLPFRPTYGALRDLDGDGRADLIAAANASLAGVALADGQGSFGAVTTLTLSGIAAGLAVADLDGDGNPDLLFPIGSPAGLAVFYGKGDGTFEAEVTQTLGGRPGNIAIGDFDGNGIDDAAIGNAQQNAVAIVSGSSDRVLGGLSLSFSGAPSNLACADLDADGRDDLILNSAGLLRVFFGAGNNTFTPAAQVNIGKPASGLVARDVDGDLHPDILATAQGSNDLQIAINRGNRSFAPVEVITLGLRPGAIAVADFDSDGRYDIGISGAYGWALTSDSETRVTRGDGNDDGLFTAADLVSVRSARARGARVEDILRAPEEARPTAGADANGDGRLDLADERLTIERLFD